MFWGGKCRRHDNGDQFIIAATDGLWDFLENKEAVEVVARCVREGKPQQASQRLVEAALTKAAAESHMTVQVLGLKVWTTNARNNRLTMFIYFFRMQSGTACTASWPSATSCP